MSENALEPFLVRQLRRAGISEDDGAPSEDAWRKFLKTVNEHYRHVAEDKALLERTSELAADEVNTIRERMAATRAALRTALTAVASGLGALGKIAGEGVAPEGTTESTPSLSAAKEETTRELERIFADATVAEDANGEVDLVASSLTKLTDEIARLRDEAIDRAKIKKELETARELQDVLLPGSEPFEHPYVQIAGASRSAAECGGDVWSVDVLAEDRVLVMIGDVTGHGIAASIVAGAAKAACALSCHTTNGALTASEALSLMNTAIHETAKRQVMMTCSTAVIDPATNTLTLANAGHHFAYLIRAGAARPLVAQGPPLGAGKSAEYEPLSVAIQPQDVLVWFTDGAIELENELGEQFTEKRLRAVCQRLAKDGAVATREGVLEVLDGFRGSSPQTDDVTVVVAAIK